MKIFKRQDGSALIELALIFPVFLVMLFGTMDLVGVMQQYQRVCDTTRTAALAGTVRTYAAIGSSNVATISAIATNSGAGLPGYSATVTQFCTCGSASSATVACSSYAVCPSYGIPAQYVKVVGKATLPVLFTVKGLPSSIPVQSTTVVRTAWTN